MAVKGFNFTGEATALVAFDHADNFGELVLIPSLPGRFASGAPFLPVMHVEPLNVADARRRLHLCFALHQDGLDVPTLNADRDRQFVKANAWISRRVFGEER